MSKKKQVPMDHDNDVWFLDFCEDDQTFHLSPSKELENEEWKNVCRGRRLILCHFCYMVKIITFDFGKRFTVDQIIRLAECTPGLTVHVATPVPENEFDYNVYMNPISSKETIEQRLEWKQVTTNFD